MRRAHGGRGGDAAAAAAAATAVAPLLQLKRAAAKAESLERHSRALELYERALAAAELAQPRDSLIIAAMLDEQRITRMRAAQGTASSSAVAVTADLNQRLFPLLHARWQAGTLFTPTAEETAYLVEDEYPRLPAQMCGALFYLSTATDELVPAPAECARRFLLPCTPAEAEARLQGLYGALRTALELNARGMLERNPHTGQAWQASTVAPIKTAAHLVVRFALRNAAVLLRMRATCGLTAAEEAALRQLAERHNVTAESIEQQLPMPTKDYKALQQQVAAADAARHGLRRCALPSCDAQEPHPKLFKLCGRCRGAAYCCAAHSAEDWKRHKREDGCAAAP
jgi:hypothetical protein